MREPKTWLEAPEAGAACTIIAEVAQAHDGSLGMAHAYIDTAAAAGADAIKFQTHIASAESTPSEPWRTKFSRQDRTRLDYWRRMEFSPEQWQGLKDHAVESGLLFLSSPFSMEAVELLRSIGVAGWKVASGEITNFPMLERMGEDGRPIILSTGMSEFAEIDAAVDLLKAYSAPLAVLQCTTQYPSPPEAVGLNVLAEFRERYGTATGLSDHSGTLYPALAAATLGVEIIEVHVTMSREMFGPDVPASVTSKELKQLTEGVRFIEKIRANPIDKAVPVQSMAPLREIFLKSVVAISDLPAGTLLTAENITTKKPGTGIPATRFKEMIGRRLARGIEKDIPLLDEDLEA